MATTTYLFSIAQVARLLGEDLELIEAIVGNNCNRPIGTDEGVNCNVSQSFSGFIHRKALGDGDYVLVRDFVLQTVQEQGLTDVDLPIDSDQASGSNVRLDGVRDLAMDFGFINPIISYPMVCNLKPLLLGADRYIY